MTNALIKKSQGLNLGLLNTSQMLLSLSHQDSWKQRILLHVRKQNKEDQIVHLKSSGSDLNDKRVTNCCARSNVGFQNVT